MPVMRSIERMLEPSANAPITAIFLSVLSTFAMANLDVITVPQQLDAVNIFLGYNYQIMWKVLAILILISTVAQKPLPVNRDQKQAYPQAHEDAPHNATPPFCSVSDIDKENADNAKRYTYYKSHPKEYLKAALAPANASNWVLAFLGIIGACIAIVTLLTLKGQTNHVVASERAWVTVGISQPSLEDMSIRAKPDNYGVGIGLTFKNLGKTPSKIVGSYVRALMADSVDPNARPISPNLPESPDYSLKLEHSIIAQPGIFWMPRQKFEYLVFLPKMFFEKDLARWEISEKALCIYGFIEYVDVFNRNHNTRFCYVYAPIRASLPLQNPASGEMIFPPGFCLSGPKAYNLCD